MKIRMIVPCLYVGGMERLVINLARVMIGRGHDVAIVSLDGVGVMDAEAARLGVPVHVVNSRGWRSVLRPSPLSEYFARERPDVVHSHGGAWMRTVGAARVAGIPVRVQTVHGFHEVEALKMRMIELVLARATSRVVVVSEQLRQHYASSLRVPVDSLPYIRNGILRDDTAATATADRATLGLHASHRVAIAVGRLFPVKAHRHLIAAFAQVADADPQAHLLIVGDGPEREGMEADLDRLQLHSRVSLLGHRDDVVPLLRTADLFVLPSHSEGLSISLLEAMAQELPVVATAVGSTPEVATPDIGVLVPPGDVSQLAAAMVALLAAPETRASMAKAAAARVAASFSIERTADDYLNIYRSLLAQGFRAA